MGRRRAGATLGEQSPALRPGTLGPRAAKSTFIVTWPNLTSAITTARPTGSKAVSVLILRFAASSEAPHLPNDWCLMSKKKDDLTQEEQSKRFQNAVQDMVDAGELSPTEAEAALDKIVRKMRSPQQ